VQGYSPDGGMGVSPSFSHFLFITFSKRLGIRAKGEGMGEICDINRSGKCGEAAPGKVDKASLQGEIGALREALEQVMDSMKSGEADLAKMGGVAARLSDSIGKALLAEQKLSAGNNRANRLHEEFARVLRDLGVNEEL
jgi:hypothetical protein